MSWERKNVTLESRWAENIYGAFVAFGSTGYTRSTSVGDDRVIHDVPSILGYKLHQGVFDFDGVRSIHHAKEIHNTCHVGINRDSGNVETVGQNTISSLSSHPRKGDELIKGGRHGVVEMFDQSFTATADALGLVLVKTCGMNVLLEFLHGDEQIVLW